MKICLQLFPFKRPTVQSVNNVNFMLFTFVEREQVHGDVAVAVAIASAAAAAALLDYEKPVKLQRQRQRRRNI